jgi:hypothetical protein
MPRAVVSGPPSHNRHAWRPSRPQAEFIAALCAPEPSAEEFAGWCRRYAAGPVDDGVVELLPSALHRLLEMAPRAEITRRARAAYLENSTRNLVRVERLLAVVHQLQRVGISCVLLKGMAVAIRYYGSLGARGMGDVDLLVRPDDLTRTVDELARAGWRVDGQVSTRVLQASVARVQHAVALSAGPTHSLDLHWHLHPSVTPEVEEAIWSAVNTITFDRTRLQVLDPTDQIFHACCHAVQPTWGGSPRWMLDVHAVMRAEGSRVQWDRLVRLARHTHTAGRLQAAIAALDSVMFTGMPPAARQALAEAHPSRWERDEVGLSERTPPFGGLDRLWWHYYLFRRLRLHDAMWSRLPIPLGFVDYLRVKRRVHRVSTPT